MEFKGNRLDVLSQIGEKLRIAGFDLSRPIEKHEEIDRNVTVYTQKDLDGQN